MKFDAKISASDIKTLENFQNKLLQTASSAIPAPIIVLQQSYKFIYFNGSLEGVPAFRGYFFGVAVVFFMGRNARSMSVPGSVV